MPFTRSKLVSRPRLHAQVMDGLNGPLTLIIAPAGFGKTTLLASCITECKATAVWLSLDKDDNQVERFLKYVIAALQKVDQTIGHDATTTMAASPQSPPEFIMTTLVNDLDALGTEVVFVLDDYHTISSQAVHSAVIFLLEHCPTTLHVVIASRSDPPLPLARLRARAQIVELRTADLSFTEDETSRFVREITGLDLDRRSIAMLEQRIEGWIAGLQMAALAMRGRDDVQAFIEDFSGTNRYVLDYLLEEVLAHESEKTQNFLLQTSLLTRLTGSLCDAVAGTTNSAEMLEQLEQRNLFIIPLDDERRWYRYHHLFADLLQATLHKAQPDQVAVFHSRAADWCEQNGYVDEAINYAFAAQDFAQAANLIEGAWVRATGEGAIGTVWTWLDALPDDLVRKSAALSSAACWTLWLRGQIDLIEPRLRDAEKALRNQKDLNSGSGDGMPAQLTILRSIVARHHNQLEAASQLAKHALSLIPESISYDEDAVLRLLVYRALASAYEGRGDLDQAVSAYMEAIRWGQRANNAAAVAGFTYRLVVALQLLARLEMAAEVCRMAFSYVEERDMTRLPGVGILHVAASEVLVERNELNAVEKHLTQGMELGRWSGRLDAVRNAAFARVRLHLARNDAEGMVTAVQEAISALDAPPSPLAKAELLALKARVDLHQGAIHDAVRCVGEAKDLASWDRGLTGSLVRLAEIRVTAAQQASAEAVSHLTQAIKDAQDMGQLGAVIELSIIRSLTFADQGKMPDAYADLERVLGLAAPEGYVRVFLDEGQRMQILIGRWLSQAGESRLRDYAGRVLAQFDAEPHPTAVDGTSSGDALIEPLTARELEVLHIIALGKTNQEIADQLVVARGTVKAHTASIYRKLDVTNRTEAVARARQLGILP